MSRPEEHLKLTLRRTLRQPHRPLCDNRVLRFHLHASRFPKFLQMVSFHVPPKRWVHINETAVSVRKRVETSSVLATENLRLIHWQNLTHHESRRWRWHMLGEKHLIDSVAK